VTGASLLPAAAAVVLGRCRVTAMRAAVMRTDGDADARDADERHWDEVDDDEEQQEEAATELSAEVVEPVGADLPRRRAVPASYRLHIVGVPWHNVWS